MPILNVTHDEVNFIKKASVEEMAALDSDILPSRTLLDPRNYRGARCVRVSEPACLVQRRRSTRLLN
jgi:hypothetical protein